MKGRRLLELGSEWVFANVPQEKIDMDQWYSPCGTTGCWLGWLAMCPLLNEFGFRRAPNDPRSNFAVHDAPAYSEDILNLFNLTAKQFTYLFGNGGSGQIIDMRARLAKVLAQPGPEEVVAQVNGLKEAWAAEQKEEELQLCSSCSPVQS